MGQHYTVVGVYPDQSADERAREGVASFVEWVEADSPTEAWQKAAQIEEERESAWPVAIFAGRHTDRLPDGMPIGQGGGA